LRAAAGPCRRSLQVAGPGNEWGHRNRRRSRHRRRSVWRTSTPASGDYFATSWSPGTTRGGGSHPGSRPPGARAGGRGAPARAL